MFDKKKDNEPGPAMPQHEGERGVSRWLVMLSVLYVIAGCAMIVWPNLTLDMLGVVLGSALLIIGCANIIIYLTRDHLDGILQMDLTEGVFFVAFGAYMLLHRDFVESALPFGAGILILVGGISHIQYALDMRRLRFVHWYIMLIFAVILIALAAVLIYNPFAGNILIRFIAVSLILNGAATIISILTISHRFKKIRAGYVPAPLKSGRRDSGKVIVEDTVPETGGNEDIFEVQTRKD